MSNIHNTAIIGKDVKLGRNVEIGAYCIIEGNVEIGDDCILSNNVVVSRMILDDSIFEYFYEIKAEPALVLIGFLMMIGMLGHFWIVWFFSDIGTKVDTFFRFGPAFDQCIPIIMPRTNGTSQMTHTTTLNL